MVSRTCKTIGGAGGILTAVRVVSPNVPGGASLGIVTFTAIVLLAPGAISTWVGVTATVQLCRDTTVRLNVSGIVPLFVITWVWFWVLLAVPAPSWLAVMLALAGAAGEMKESRFTC